MTTRTCRGCSNALGTEYHSPGCRVVGQVINQPVRPVHCSEETREALVNERDNYKDLWEKSCQAVFELCDLAGAKPEDMHDLWTLHILIRELKGRINELEALAYIGEHRFPDLTYKARLEELLEQSRASAKEAG